MLGELIAERVPVDLAGLYGDAMPGEIEQTAATPRSDAARGHKVRIEVPRPVVPDSGIAGAARNRARPAIRSRKRRRATSRSPEVSGTRAKPHAAVLQVTSTAKKRCTRPIYR